MTTWSPRLDIGRRRYRGANACPSVFGGGAIGQTVPMARTRKAPPGVDVRLALLDAAGELLLAEGAEGMTTRRLAAMAGTTTQAIYTEFGGKEGIARAMYREGFARL